MKRINRMNRKMIRKIALAVGVSLAFSGCGGIGNSANPNSGVSGEVYAMDTYMTYTLYGDRAQEAADEVLKEIERLDALLSTEQAQSEIYILNQNKGGVLSEDTAFLWDYSRRISDETQGAFAVGIYPVMKLWGFGEEKQQVPDEEALKEVLPFVDLAKAEWTEQSKLLTLPEGAAVDFGGIAKGYTGYRLRELLKQFGIEHALINLGGNVQLIGSKPDGTSYRIGIKDPMGGASPVGVLSVKDVAVISSGGYERYFEEGGIRYHHIIDPATGYPAESGLASVTIVAEDGTLADAYSTALYVMGLDKACSFWRERPETFQAVFVTEEGKILITKGLEGVFTSPSKYETIK